MDYVLLGHYVWLGLQEEGGLKTSWWSHSLPSMCSTQVVLPVATHLTTVNGILCAFARELPHDRCYKRSSEVSAVKTLRRPITRTEQRLASHRVALSLPLGQHNLIECVSYQKPVPKTPDTGSMISQPRLGTLYLGCTSRGDCGHQAGYNAHTDRPEHPV